MNYLPSNEIPIIGLANFSFDQLSTRVLIITIIIVLIASCGEEQTCTHEDWMGTYVGSVTCDGVRTEGVTAIAGYGIDTFILDIEGFWSFDYVQEECEYEYDQDPYFYNDYTTLYVRYQLDGVELIVEHVETISDVTTSCRAVLYKQ